MLIGYLRFHRSTLLAICNGLAGDQLASRPVVSSQLSLLGLVRHGPADLPREAIDGVTGR